MSHYSVATIQTRLTWSGRVRAKEIARYWFHTYTDAQTFTEQLNVQGVQWLLEDFGTDPGIPAPLTPGEDNDDPEAWEYAKAQRQIEKINQSNGGDTLPF